MAKKSMAMASSSLAGEAFEAVEFYVSDSDSWEVVDPSGSDDDNLSYDGETTDGGDDVVEEVRDLLQPCGSPSSDLSMPSLANEGDQHREEVQNHTHEVNLPVDGSLDGGDDPYEKGVDENNSEEEEDDDDDASDLDDELVPRWVTNRFERQRMRKLGKRAYPKMNKSKRMVYQYNRPGCVHGKHGLGLKHSLVY